MEKKTVVVVDDSAYSRARLIELVEGLGYEVVGEGRDGEEGLKLIQEHQPDLVLTDLAMPEMDGGELVRHKLVRQLNIPCILVSADLDPRGCRMFERGSPHVTALDKGNRKAIIAAIRRAFGDED